eukprot:TRINITY_DN69170_c0_g1_i1.p1 TRINITY_DN69170_c0_g1~~TRINITY_DN69170_c0_g1_i1.p1  ORF type:complete len:771 (-),score=122.74 TRINITY_DN69170_c0_g1_i1:96-2408(-)
MIRAPVVNTLLSVAKTTGQLLSRRNAFEEAVAGPLAAAPLRQAGAAVGSSVGNRGGTGVPSTTKPTISTPSQSGNSALDLRSLTSCPLWLLACHKMKRALSHASAKGDKDDALALLSRFGSLLRLGGVLSQLGALGPQWLRRPFSKLADNWYNEAIRNGLKNGVVVAGVTRGVPAKVLLAHCLEPSIVDLMKREAEQRASYEAAVNKGLSGKGHLHLSDGDLLGLSDKMRSVWASQAGSLAVWRSKPYKVPVGHDSMDRIMSFCQQQETRRRFFEKYYANFGPELDRAALNMLRARKELANRYGFGSWAEYELRPLSVSDPAAARELMDRFWGVAVPAYQPVLKRMEQLAADTMGRGSGGGGARRFASRIAQIDESFYRAMVTKEADTWKLADFLPAEKSVPRIFEVVGRAYNVTFHEAKKADYGDRLLKGWHQSVRIFEVTDGASHRATAGVGKSLGFVYLDLYHRHSMLGRSSVQLAGATLLCSGHAYLSMNFQGTWMNNKLFNPEEAVALAHELGHAVHMLCHGQTGTIQDFEDLPLDVLELPSTLVETIALEPGVISQYARHYASGGPPPDALMRVNQRDPHHFLRCLQSASVALGLHGPDFDPHAASPEEFRSTALALWQRYSPFEAHPGFTPLGQEPGLHLAQGSTHVAYLLCYLRVDAILHSSQSGRGASRGDAARRWLSEDFAGRVRAQLLDRAFPGERLASLMPPLATGRVAVGKAGDKSSVESKKHQSSMFAAVQKHPLPPPPIDATGLVGRASQQASYA